MSRFAYVALDAKGRENKGQLDAANPLEAVSRLKEMGWFPTKVTEAKTIPGKPGLPPPKPVGGLARLSNIRFGSRRMKPKHLATMTRQLFCARSPKISKAATRSVKRWPGIPRRSTSSTSTW
jgi:type IV pilus assembly protein PilC